MASQTPAVREVDAHQPAQRDVEGRHRLGRRARHGRAERQPAARPEPVHRPGQPGTPPRPSTARRPAGCRAAGCARTPSSVSTSLMVARAAAIETGLPNSVPPTATCGLSSSRPPGRCSTAATSSVIPYAPSGMPAAIDLPTVTKSGVEAPPPGQPAGTDHLRVRLVVGQQRAGTPGQLAQAVVEAVVRHQQPDVVGERRLGDHHRDLAAGERALEGLEVVERHHERACGDVVRQAVLLRHQAAVRRARPARRRSGRGTCRRRTAPSRGRSVTRAIRMTSVLALVAASVNCHSGRP